MCQVRDLWEEYYSGADAIVFMVDSADHERFEEAKTEMQQVRLEIFMLLTYYWHIGFFFLGVSNCVLLFQLTSKCVLVLQSTCNRYA